MLFNKFAGRALLTSDEGQRILGQVNLKQSRNEGERALLNKMWMGIGDQSVLLEQDRGFEKSTFSMAIFIQPGPLCTELANLGGSDGFLDRIIMFVDKPHLSKSSDMTKASQRMAIEYHDKFLVNIVLALFNFHLGKMIQYQFEADAQTYFDSLADEHASEINALYDTTGKHQKY